MWMSGWVSIICNQARLSEPLRVPWCCPSPSSRWVRCVFAAVHHVQDESTKSSACICSLCKVQSKARICCNPYLCTKQLDQPHDGPRHLLLPPRQTQLGVVLGHELATRWPRQPLQTTPMFDRPAHVVQFQSMFGARFRGKLVHWSQRLCLPPTLASLARLAVRPSFSCSLARG
jgi:hypothetical protein